MIVCLSFSPVTNWQLVPCVPFLSHKDSWDKLQYPIFRGCLLSCPIIANESSKKKSQMDCTYSTLF